MQKVAALSRGPGGRDDDGREPLQHARYLGVPGQGGAKTGAQGDGVDVDQAPDPVRVGRREAGNDDTTIGESGEVDGRRDPQRVQQLGQLSHVQGRDVGNVGTVRPAAAIVVVAEHPVAAGGQRHEGGVPDVVGHARAVGEDDDASGVRAGELVVGDTVGEGNERPRRAATAGLVEGVDLRIGDPIGGHEPEADDDDDRGNPREGATHQNLRLNSMTPSLTGEWRNIFRSRP